MACLIPQLMQQAAQQQQQQKQQKHISTITGRTFAAAAGTCLNVITFESNLA